MGDAFGGTVLAELGEIEPGAEMITLAAQDDGARRLGQIDKGRMQLRNQRVIDGVALGRAMQADMQHRLPRLDAQEIERIEDRWPRGRAWGRYHWLIFLIMWPRGF